MRGFLVGALALVMVVTTGCGVFADNGSITEQSPTAITVDAANGAITLPGPATRIVSLSPTATEMLFAIGAGDSVIAVDDYSTYPEHAPRTTLSGYSPNAESITTYRPDLVVVSDDNNDVITKLTTLKIPVLHEPAATKIDDTYDQITDLGLASGRSSQAAELISQMRQRIDATVASVDKTRQRSYYHELDSAMYTITSATFIGGVYRMFGLRNIADAADAQGNGYPQVSAEALLAADPDLIFLSHGGRSNTGLDEVAARPGWSSLTAVRAGHVFALDDDIASRWGPRLPDLVDAIAAAVRQAS